MNRRRIPVNFRPRTPPRAGIAELAHLAGLCALAVAHPVYSLLAREEHAPFFVAHQSRPIDIAVVVAGLSLVLPASVWLLVKLTDLFSRRVSALVFSAVFAVLLAAVLLPLVSEPFDSYPVACVAISAISALLLTVGYWRLQPVRTFFSLLSLAAIISPLLFIFSAPVQSILSTEYQTRDRLFSGDKDRPNIVMIIFDELPMVSLLDEKGSIDPIRYPNFARLGRVSTWYRNTLTTHYATTGAISSLLVGGQYSQYRASIHHQGPVRSAILDRSKAPYNLFSLLESDYRIQAIESTSHLAPTSQSVQSSSPPLADRARLLSRDMAVLYLYSLLPTRWESSLPNISGQWARFGAGAVEGRSGPGNFPGAAGAVGQMIDLIRPDPTPTFYYLHLLLPHFPFVFTESGEPYRNVFPFLDESYREATGTNQWPDAPTAALVQQAHLRQLGYTDALLGAILDRIEAAGMFDDALIVVAADHGTSFYWNTGSLSTEQMRRVQASETLLVPLFIKWPGQSAAKVNDLPAQTIDLVPTIADFLDISPNWKTRGISLLGDIPPDRIRSAFVPKLTNFPPAMEEADIALRRKTELMGSRDRERLDYIGPDRGLVGTPVGQLAAVDSQAEYHLFGEKNKEEARSLDGSGPTYLEGKVMGWPATEDTNDLGVAIALNGVVANTAYVTRHQISTLPKGQHSFESDSDDKSRSEVGDALYFMAWIPATRLQPESNDVEIFLLQPRPEDGPAGHKTVYRLTSSTSN